MAKTQLIGSRRRRRKQVSLTIPPIRIRIERAHLSATTPIRRNHLDAWLRGQMTVRRIKGSITEKEAERVRHIHLQIRREPVEKNPARIRDVRALQCISRHPSRKRLWIESAHDRRRIVLDRHPQIGFGDDHMHHRSARRGRRRGRRCRRGRS